ncbi:unnamed protein product [Rotaria magnacalcarata]|nr:unnamed protein product [Rotaria magnacalcarata]CAF3791922.1 unnamed protein product [Rotaria magnacalcarata]CAF3871514.1 unnamed protein product [Rotaria magnacalcarata]
MPSLSNIQRKPRHDRLAFDNTNGLKPELRRLATFGSLPRYTHSIPTKGVLAKLGIYYTGKADIVKCDGCDFEHELFAPEINPIEEHRKQSPQCQFVLDNNASSLKHDQQLLSSIATSARRNVVASNHQTEMDLDDDDDDADDESPQKLFIKSLPKETLEKIRENTFSNWPIITPSAKDMINSGWAFTNISDRVICIYCNIIAHKWKKTDQPYEMHRLKSPRCPFVLATEKMNSAKSSATKIEITNAPNVEAAVVPVHNNYTLAPHRYETFQSWPHSEINPLPSIESFVNAGFFYTGANTTVRCFYCNGSLLNWQSSDDPKIEHCRWFPQCAYIRQYVGEDLYQATQNKNREIQVQQSNSNDNNAQRSQSIPWTGTELDRMVKARLDLPIVETLRRMSFTMGIIRKTFEIQLKNKHDDFKTDNDLRLACLILHQQVKLINGNENILLVPEDWMNKYIEEQKRAMDQSTPEHLETLQTSVKNAERPKVLTHVTAQPKIVPKPDEESMLCVLCLTTERQVACLPCGHFTSCVACGHSLRTCPICRAVVKAFVRKSAWELTETFIFQSFAS